MSETTFNTAFAVDAGNISLGHPSMFQTPEIDAALFNNIEKAKTIDPQNIWQSKVSFQQPATTNNVNMTPQYTVPFDPKDKPLTKAEREHLISRTSPLMEKTFTNKQPTLL